MCTWEAAGGGTAPTSDECQAKVAGILNWLFGVWYTEVKKRFHGEHRQLKFLGLDTRPSIEWTPTRLTLARELARDSNHPLPGNLLGPGMVVLFIVILGSQGCLKARP